MKEEYIRGAKDILRVVDRGKREERREANFLPGDCPTNRDIIE